MSKILGNRYYFPYDAERPLRFRCSCGADHSITNAHVTDGVSSGPDASCPQYGDAQLSGARDDHAQAFLEAALVRALFPADDLRRNFLRAVGKRAAMAAIASVLPIEALSAMAQEVRPPERKALKVGFLPITCATPLIMAEVLGYYQEQGLAVDLQKNTAFGLVRDKIINGELDAGLMLATMPLAASMGLGSPPVPLRVAMIENVNGIAMILALKHRNNRDPRNWRGMRIAVPMEYSVQNLMLRYYLAEAGIDPDRDVQIRVVVPTEFVSNLRAGNIDAFLGADPLNQRAIYEEAGFFHMALSSLWNGHPCCAFTMSASFIEQYPDTFSALLRAVLKGSAWSRGQRHRREIARIMAVPKYLNQPEIVVRQALTGRFADGLGNVVSMPDRVEFNPIPWQSMAVWMLTQLRRWGYVKADVDYAALARQVFLLTDAHRAMQQLGESWPSRNYDRFDVMGKPFDSADPHAYLRSFSIGRHGDATSAEKMNG